MIINVFLHLSFVARASFMIWHRKHARDVTKPSVAHVSLTPHFAQAVSTKNSLFTKANARQIALIISPLTTMTTRSARIFNANLHVRNVVTLQTPVFLAS